MDTPAASATPAAPAAAISPAPAAGAAPAAPAADPAAAPVAPAAQPPAPAASPAQPAAPAEIEIKLPDGAKVDQARLDAFKTKAKELGLSSKQATDLVAMQLEAVAQQTKALTDQIAKFRVGDEAALKADPAFGGAKFEATVKSSKSALAQFDDKDEAKNLFVQMGIDNHPAIVKLLARAWAQVGEDNTPIPQPTPNGNPLPQSLTQRIAGTYPASSK